MKVCSKPNSRKQGKQLAHYKVDLHKKKKRKKISHKCVLKINRNIHTFLAICRTCSFAMAFTTACLRASPMSPFLAKAGTSSLEQLRGKDGSNTRQYVHKPRKESHVFCCKFSKYQTTLSNIKSFPLSQ